MISGAGSQGADGDGFPKLRGAVQLTSMHSQAAGGRWWGQGLIPGSSQDMSGWQRRAAWGRPWLGSRSRYRVEHGGGGTEDSRADLTLKAPGACDKDSVW